MLRFSTTEINKLVNTQSNIEKSLDIVLEHLKTIPEYDVYQYSLEMNRERESECETLRIKIDDMLKPLGDKVRLIQGKHFSEIKDYNQFKKQMIEIQDSIHNLKCETKTKIELLEKESVFISDDLRFYKEKLLTWAEPVIISTNIDLFIKPKTIRNHHKCKEVKDFMDFLHASGGHENGWRKEDHQLFLKLRNKHKYIEIVAKNLNDQLPDISVDDIKKHEEWYKKYLRLQRKKKEAITLWQKSKAVEKTPLRTYNVSSKIDSLLKGPEENMREKLKKWKNEREEKFKTNKELQRSQVQRRRDLEILKKKQQEETKKVVQEWKKNKQTMEEEEMTLKMLAEEYEKRRRASEANKMIKQFQTQDDMYILKMRQQKKQEVNSDIRSKSSNLAKRDPERLLRPTRQWINRVHDENCYSNGFVTIMDLKSLPKLFKPEWRKQVVD